MKANSKANIKLKGSEGFDTYYSCIFGSRWNALKEALLSESIYVELAFGGEQNYFLDPASVCAALCLPVRNADKVLDLCAAPGGKSLVLAGNVSEGSVLYSNELSAERKMRLSKVIAQTLPESLSKRVSVSCSDGATWCRRETEVYDSILLDVPCSSERHVMQDSKYLNEWSESRTRQLAVEQWALLSCAWRLLKKSGFLVYSTCAISPCENDGIISRLIKKFDGVRIVNRKEIEEFFIENRECFCGKINEGSNIVLQDVLKNAEETDFGLHIMPDSANGAGPIFFSVMQKLT